MRKFNASYFKDFRDTVLKHNLVSGEIILEIWEHDQSKHDSKALIDELIDGGEFLIEGTEFELIEIGRKDAFSSIKYGLSTKVNYTRIDRPFSESEQNQYANGFIEFFDNPKLLTVELRLFRMKLDLEDFWEVGGAIVVDNNKIGIFWINDLYGKFR